MEIIPIATIYNDFEDKFAVPRQSGIAGIDSEIVFTEKYAEPAAVKGLDGFSHLWLIWGFSESIREDPSLTVRPPRLGGNTRVGVFASRSPFRPNHLGLSSVKLEEIRYDDKGKPILKVSGADLISGTPIYDIKPYIRFTDSHEDAVSGFVDSTPFPLLTVHITDELLQRVPEEKQKTLLTILENDPRPAYQENPERIYGFHFAGLEIRFKVKDNELEVTEIYDRSRDNEKAPD